MPRNATNEAKLKFNPLPKAQHNHSNIYYMRYGIPYKGSKNKIAEWVVGLLPEADTLVDLFAGGCAVTDCAMRSGKWQHFTINDIEWMPTQLFLDAIHGKYKDDERWISRDAFKLLKDSDPYVRYCWSFGNNGANYLYSKEIEPYKQAMHRLMYTSSTRERRTAYSQCIQELTKYLYATGKTLSGGGQRLINI